MRNYVSKEVTCPFYSQESELTIHCEGAVPAATSTRTTFGSRRSFMLHKHRFCNEIDRNAHCPIFNAINSKY